MSETSSHTCPSVHTGPHGTRRPSHLGTKLCATIQSKLGTANGTTFVNEWNVGAIFVNESDLSATIANQHMQQGEMSSEDMRLE